MTVAASATSAVDWLLASREPAIRRMARRDLLDEASADEPILDGPLVRGLFAGQQPDGGFGVHPYRKWTGAHWRLVSLVELEIPPGEPRAMRAAETVLRWLTHPASARRSAVFGLPLSDASMEGNAIGACSRLGLADDPRVRQLVDWVVEWQWPDGGWNCDNSATGRRSSFHETLATMWGLHEYAVATGSAAARAAAERAAELILEHRIFRRHGTGQPIHPSWTVIHHPPYWHHDFLQALHVLRRMGRVRDPRTSDALDLLERRRLPDGRWRAGAYWWQPPGSPRAPEAVDWGRGTPSEMITLNALRVLRAGRA